jgi:hypothetical protein
MPLDRERRVFRLHAFAIVLDTDLFLSAELHVNSDPARAGIDRILDELLDDGSRRSTTSPAAI